MNKISIWRLTMLVAGCLMMTMRDAQAYIDPGSTSYFFQVLIAGLTAVVFFFSSLKRRVAGFFKALFRKDDRSDEAALPPPKTTPPES